MYPAEVTPGKIVPLSGGVSLVVGSGKPAPFFPGGKVVFDQTMMIAVNDQPAQVWTPSLTTVKDAFGGKYPLRVEVTNVRGMKDPYEVAKALFTVATLVSAAALGAVVSDKLAQFLAAVKADQLIDIAKKFAGAGLGSLVEEALGWAAGLFTDMFEDWPDCTGVVLSDSVDFNGLEGEQLLTTSGGIRFPEGCGNPNYSLRLTLKKQDDLFPPRVVEDWDCRYRPHRVVGGDVSTTWLRGGATTFTVGAADAGQSPIMVKLSPGGGGLLDVYIRESTRDRNAVALSHDAAGVQPSMHDILQARMIGVPLKQSDPDPLDAEGARTPLKFSHQVDSVDVAPRRDVLPWWVKPKFGNVVGVVSRISLPDLDIEIDLYERYCVDRVSNKVKRTPVLYYRRGAIAASRAGGQRGVTVSTATLEPAAPPVN